MKKYTHKCIKSSCDAVYTDTDPDAYYCQACLGEKQAVAKQIDKQFAGRSREPVKTELDEYEENAINVNGMRLMKVKL